MSYMKFLVTVLIIPVLVLSVMANVSALKSEYRRGLEDGLMAGRSEAYALLSKGSRANAENYVKDVIVQEDTPEAPVSAEDVEAEFNF